jgi:hypothetical protein
MFEAYGVPDWIMSDSFEDARNTISSLRKSDGNGGRRGKLFYMRKNNADWWCNMTHKLMHTVRSALMI